MTTLAAALLLVGSSTLAGATPVDHRDAALTGADRLLDIQFESGAFPWIVGQEGEFQNVQGVTAVGLLDAYTLSLDDAYLEGAEANRDWLEANMGETTSAPNVYFLVKYALLTQELDDIQLARDALEGTIEAYGSPRDLAEAILDFRAGSAWTNLGLWDVALFVRAAHDIGNTTASAEFAEVLAEQTGEDGIVDAYDESANVYELGLTGLLFGLSEADFLQYSGELDDAKDALLATQCEDGSFPITWNGEVTCGRVQETAYAALGLMHALGPVPAAQEACDFLVGAQEENGGWLESGTEFGEQDSEAVQGLSACILPVHNGATSYADAAVGLL